MSYQTEPITMWFDRRLVLRKSPIHNIGTFATHDIFAGELLIMVTGGIVVTSEDRQSGNKLQLAADMYNEESLADNLFIVTPKMFHYYINHSCDANAVDLSRSANSTQYIAARDIRANEEITADYFDKTTLEICECKSLSCRWKGI